MSWVLTIGVAWLAIAVVTTLVVGRAIHLADRRERPPAVEPPVDGENRSLPLGLDDETVASVARHKATVPQARAAANDAGRHKGAALRHRLAGVNNPTNSP